MKLHFLSLSLFVLSCTPQAPNTTGPVMVNHTVEKKDSLLPSPAVPEPQTEGYRGTLEGNIPVQILYQIDEGDVVTGSIRYLETKGAEYIRLIGSFTNGEFRLLEFQKGGLITGIITCREEDGKLLGDWFSPKTRKTRTFELSHAKLKLPLRDISTPPDSIGGTYSYAYSKDGPQGTLTLKPLAGGKALLEISAVTNEPARNIADVPPDTVTLEGDRIIYRFPDAPECSFQVRIYKGFAVVNYLTNAGCTSQFGHNATVEGTFLKTGK